MRGMQTTGCVLVLAAAVSIALHSQSRQSATVLYENARVIVGDGSAFDTADFLVQDGRITRIGTPGSVTPPAGVRRVSLAGRTVMPTLVNVHVHIGYEGYSSWGANNYTAKNVLDHLQREAF